MTRSQYRPAKPTSAPPPADTSEKPAAPARLGATVTADDLDALLGLDSDEELTAEQLAALARLDDGPLSADENDDPYGAGFGPDTCPPEGWDQMPAAERQALLEAPPAAVVPEVLDAGFTHRDGGPGLGFAAGGVLDRMEPGGLLTMLTDRAWQNGLGKLSDSELIGLMTAQRRLASRAAAGELAAVAELATRRSGSDGRPGEHVEEEVAAALTLTGRAAGLRVAVAEGLARLPGVGRALAAGRIDADKAEVFTGQLMLLEYLAANAIAGVILPKAPGMTTGQLRAALVAQIMDYDPAAVVRRRKQAEKDARVETWTEAAGTGAVAGRDCRRPMCWPRTRPWPPTPAGSRPTALTARWTSCAPARSPPGSPASPSTR